MIVFVFTENPDQSIPSTMGHAVGDERWETMEILRGDDVSKFSCSVFPL